MKMKKGNCGGFTLFEVLIAMVVLAVGVLGLGMLQLAALQNTQGGYFRSQASILAYDIIDAMRANIPATNNGDYRIAFADATPADVDCYGLAADCSTGELATSDLVRWRTILGVYLPSGNGQVDTVDIGTTTRVTVSLQWMDPYSAEAGSEQLVLVAELPQ